MLAIRDGEFTPKSLDVNYGCRNMYTYNMYIYIHMFIYIYIYLLYMPLYLLYLLYIYIYVSRQKGYPPLSSNVGKAMEKALHFVDPYP